MLQSLLLAAAAAVGQVNPVPPASAPAAAPPAVANQPVVAPAGGCSGLVPAPSHRLFNGSLFNHGGGCNGSLPAHSFRLFNGGLFSHGGGCNGSTPVVTSQTTHWGHSGGFSSWFHGLRSSHHSYVTYGNGCTGGSATIASPAPSASPETAPAPAKALPNSPDAAPKKTTSRDVPAGESVTVNSLPVVGTTAPSLIAPPAILTREVTPRP